MAQHSQDVIVADSLEDGRQFATDPAVGVEALAALGLLRKFEVFEHLKDAGIKCRVVTLNGETISRDGNLAAGPQTNRPQP